MKTMLACGALALCLGTTPAHAGGETIGAGVVAGDATGSSSGIMLPLLLLVVVAAAAAS